MSPLSRRIAGTPTPQGVFRAVDERRAGAPALSTVRPSGRSGNRSNFSLGPYRGHRRQDRPPPALIQSRSPDLAGFSVAAWRRGLALGRHSDECLAAQPPLQTPGPRASRFEAAAAAGADGSACWINQSTKQSKSKGAWVEQW